MTDHPFKQYACPISQVVKDLNRPGLETLLDNPTWVIENLVWNLDSSLFKEIYLVTHYAENSRRDSWKETKSPLEARAAFMARIQANELPERSRHDDFDFQESLAVYLLENGRFAIVQDGHPKPYDTLTSISCYGESGEAWIKPSMVIRTGVGSNRLLLAKHIKEIREGLFGALGISGDTEYETTDSAPLIVANIRQAAKKWFMSKTHWAALERDLQWAFDRSLAKLEDLLNTRKTEPFARVNTFTKASEFDAPSDNRVLRIGVFPLTANPFHWGHIIRALDCLSILSLDTLVILPHGNVEHKILSQRDAVSADLRHQMVHEVVREFEPLLRYTDVSLGNSFLGERNIHELQRLNTALRAEWVCIWGAETLERHEFILKKLIEYGGASGRSCNPNHRLSLAVVLGNGAGTAINPDPLSQIATRLGFGWQTTYVEDDSRSSLQGLWVSSTDYRNSKDPALVPPRVHATVLRETLYDGPTSIANLSWQEALHKKSRNFRTWDPLTCGSVIDLEQPCPRCAGKVVCVFVPDSREAQEHCYAYSTHVCLNRQCGYCVDEHAHKGYMDDQQLTCAFCDRTG